MKPLPATDLRQNILTLAVPDERLPGVGRLMTGLLPAEVYDPSFQGQPLETTYFDTADFALRKARLKKEHYCTLRVRCYPGPLYALSVKTESGKFRVELPAAEAEWFLSTTYPVQFETYLPADLLARLLELTDGQGVGRVCRVSFTRYAVEDDTDRLTLDVGIVTNTGKVFPSNILEAKTTRQPAQLPAEILGLGLPPVKLSKFLWSTTYGRRFPRSENR
jgi:hypothetical protein